MMTLLSLLLAGLNRPLIFKLSFPVLGPGPLTNLSEGGQAVTNASAHVGWSLALPLLGYAMAGRTGLLCAAGAWWVLTLVSEICFHGGSPSEVRTDLLTRLVPCAVVVALLCA